MCTMELATKTMTADSTIGIHRDITGTMLTSRGTSPRLSDVSTDSDGLIVDRTERSAPNLPRHDLPRFMPFAIVARAHLRNRLHRQHRAENATGGLAWHRPSRARFRIRTGLVSRLSRYTS